MTKNFIRICDTCKVEVSKSIPYTTDHRHKLIRYTIVDDQIVEVYNLLWSNFHKEMLSMAKFENIENGSLCSRLDRILD
jgi:hypothetical protein